MKKIAMLILCFVSLFALVACNDSSSESGYKDTIETPNDLPPLADLEYVQYPEKPSGISAGQGSGMPTIGEATTTSEHYKINQADGKITITFNEVGKWDYVYIPLNNFNKEYQNIRITATGTNVQKFSCAAIYYEMYDAGLPAVTTMISDIGDTEQFYIMELGKTNLLDESYYPIFDQYLGSQTVIGLCIFIDSNPSLSVVNKNTDIESKFEITSVDFLKDGDEALKDRYVAPSLNIGACDPSFTVEKDLETKEITIKKDASATVYEAATLNIANYSSEYSAFTLKIKTENVKSLSIDLLFDGLSSWQPQYPLLEETNMVDGEYEFYIDFTAYEPLDFNTWAPVPGYYIKNYRVTGLRFLVDTAGEANVTGEASTLTVQSIEFDRIATEDSVISKGWLGSTYITVGNDIAAGGVGTIEYEWYSDWTYLNMPVLNYQTSNSLVVKFEAKDGIDYIGIALSSGSYTDAELVLKSCHDPILTDSSTAPKSGLCEGVVETVEFDSATNIYTITFDFSNAVKSNLLDGKSMNEVVINSLRFYFTDPYSSEPTFTGTHTIRFISVEFK